MSDDIVERVADNYLRQMATHGLFAYSQTESKARAVERYEAGQRIARRILIQMMHDVLTDPALTPEIVKQAIRKEYED